MAVDAPRPVVAKPIVRGGKQVGTIAKPDNDALLRLYDRFERGAVNAERRRSRNRERGRSQ